MLKGKSSRVSRCECRFEKIIASELPERFHQARLFDFPRGTAQAVRAWITNPTDGLLLTGGTGSGKTHLAAAILRDVVLGGGHIKFRRAADLYQAIRGSFHNQDNSEVSILKDYQGPGILILDDLGAGTLSDFERRYTLEVFDCRLSARKPTIVTTNWSLSEIANKLDDRIASRLSGFILLEFRGTDKRGSKTQRPSKLKQS